MGLLLLEHLTPLGALEQRRGGAAEASREENGWRGGERRGRETITAGSRRGRERLSCAHDGSRLIPPSLTSRSNSGEG